MDESINRKRYQEGTKPCQSTSPQTCASLRLDLGFLHSLVNPAMSTRPRKVHSTIKAEELQRAGWTVSSAFVADGDVEPYEYILDWPHNYAPPFLELSTVEVVRVTDLSSSYTSSKSVGRTPQVGDIGAVVYCFPYNGKTNAYEVECVDSAGETIWLTTFEHDDLKQATV